MFRWLLTLTLQLLQLRLAKVLDAGAAKKREVEKTNGMPYFRRKNGSLPAETGGLASLHNAKF